jgi:DNA-binding LacI/PurR family transcriptional regulator
MGPTTSHSGVERAKGYRAALQAAGFAGNPGWARYCRPSIEGGYEASIDLLAKSPELTALYCFNDLVAVGVLQAMAELGRSVPKDLAVVGTDDIPLAALVTPSLTTIRASLYDLGLNAAHLLINRINGCDDECGEVVLPFELVIRESAPAQVSITK